MQLTFINLLKHIIIISSAEDLSCVHHQTITWISDNLLPPLNSKDNVFISVGLSVCLLATLQKKRERMFMKFLG